MITNVRSGAAAGRRRLSQTSSVVVEAYLILKVTYAAEVTKAQEAASNVVATIVSSPQRTSAFVNLIINPNEPVKLVGEPIVTNTVESVPIAAPVTSPSPSPTPTPTNTPTPTPTLSLSPTVLPFF